MMVLWKSFHVIIFAVVRVLRCTPFIQLIQLSTLFFPQPANILLDGRGHARISDMGLVRDMSRSLPTSECGTHGYMAPEVLKADVTYDEGADWWSLGCVIYQFLAG